MWREQEEFKQALIKVGIPFRILEDRESKNALKFIYNRYTTSENYIYPLWEHLKSYKGVVYEFAWDWFGDLLGTDHIWVFFEPDSHQVIFELEPGKLLPNVLAECPMMTFYVTNISNSYLYCYNSDHAVFRVSGEAVKKFERYIHDKKIATDIINRNND